MRTDFLCLFFFDEFDCQRGSEKLGWLKSFLNPMEEGICGNVIETPSDEATKTFPEKCLAYVLSTKKQNITISDAFPTISYKSTEVIFLFGGGTSSTYLDFTREDSSIQPNEKAEFAMVKGPDFVSRLRGHINVLGSDPIDDGDETFVIRRALVLRSFLLARCPKTENGSITSNDLKKIFSPCVIQAMLQIIRYKHGVRSMRSVIDMWTQLSPFEGGGIAKRGPATLPSLEQLNMHLDGKEFLALIEKARKDPAYH